MSASSPPATEFNPNDINISVDLIPAAKNLLEFLSAISTKPELFEGPAVDYAIQRYERFWLPLAAKHPGRLLPAPVDIEWIWQCHLLAPEKYSQDCETITGRLIDHHLLEKPMRKELLKDSERLWKAEYADVPFSAADSATTKSWFDSNYPSSLTYNIKSAVSRQRTFFYQVSLPHYRDDNFLTNALLRYKKFLYLKCHNPNVFLVPCYDNDLIWHCHMMFPVYYNDDTQAYLGVVLPHDDSVNDRTKGSKLCVSEARTRVLWKKFFNEKSSYFGAMFRGQPPYFKLHAMTKDDVYRVATKQVNVLIEKFRITGLPQGKAFKLKLCYNTGYQNFNRSLFVTENIATIKGNSRTLEDYRINTSFSFDTRYNDKLIASIQKRSGRLCLGTSHILGEGKLDLQRKIQPLKTRGLTANDDIDCGDGLSVALVWSCPTPELGPCVFRLEPGEYQGCVMPQDRESLWGPIPLPRLPPGAENLCSVASHKLYNHMKKSVFTVRMIHSESMLMSAIHVFSGSKMTAVAHLIVGDHLPLPSSVNEPKKCVTLNPKEGQRAILIKNHKGDWGVAVGWWKGLQRRGSGRKGSCSEGHLEVRFFHLPTHKWQNVSFDQLYSLATSKFEIGDCMVEFDSGFIAIDSQRCEISENLALIFSVTLIHVLCQPRPTNWAPGLSSPATSQSEGSTAPPALRLGGSEDITLLIAAGVLIATPCNHAIRNLFKRKKQGFGESSAFRRTRFQRQEESPDHETESETLEPNGGPAVILHEAEVNPRCDQRKKLGKLITATRLMSITESHVDEEEEEEKSEEEEEKKDIRVKDDQVGEQGTLKQTAVAKGVVGAKVVNSADKEDDDEGDEEGEDEKEGEGVFAVDDYSGEGDGQSYMFGDGESDSDEVQADEDEEATLQSSGLMEEEQEEEEAKEGEEYDEEGHGEEEGDNQEEEVEGQEETEKQEEIDEHDGLGGLDEDFGTVGNENMDDGVGDFGNDFGNELDDPYNGMVNGFDDEYMDDAESFYTEFYNMEGDGNPEPSWGGHGNDDGNVNERNDNVFTSPTDQFNGFVDHADHNSSIGGNHNDYNFDHSYGDHDRRSSFSFDNIDQHSPGFSGSGDKGIPAGREHVYAGDHEHLCNSANYSYEGMNGDVSETPDAIVTGQDGDGGACGGCGG